MKKNSLFMSVLASLFMLGCSHEEIAPNGEDNGNGNGNSYMSINLVSSDATDSRASTGYEDGEDAENKVTKVRFYFFNGTGGAALVKLKGDKYVNYYDWTPGQGDQTGDKDDDDVESILSATIVINTAEQDKLPVMVAAVVNPTITDDISRGLSDLKAHVADYATNLLTTEGKFVMYNAVYAANNTDVSATSIKPENLRSTEADAKANPIKIYVERNVAKVSVEIAAGFDANTKRLKLQQVVNNDAETKTYEDLKVDGKQIYLELEGWDLTAESNEGRLVKKINPAWSGWNWNGSHRSFWAINSMSDNVKNVYGNYDVITNTFNTALYTNENAQKADIAPIEGKKNLNNTKVILKGKLCDADGNAYTIVRHLGAYFIDDPTTLTGLKKNILNQLALNKHYYYADGTGRTEIGEGDIDIVAVENQSTNEQSDNNCYVYAQLSEAGKAKTWYASTLQEDLSTVDNNTINNDLKNKELITWALVWKSGMTYYYYYIKHLAESNETGVVRNHVYKTKVTKIAGLGTPVYDPSKVIYPEQPGKNENYIAAEINILSWRIVSNEYELEW